LVLASKKSDSWRKRKNVERRTLERREKAGEENLLQFKENRRPLPGWRKIPEKGKHPERR